MKKVDEKFIQLRKECDFDNLNRILQGKANKDKTENDLNQ